jgi:hypothetical protein
MEDYCTSLISRTGSFWCLADSHRRQISILQLPPEHKLEIVQSHGCFATFFYQ